MITLTHTPADGTLVDGTARGDGAGEILKVHGFRWSSRIGCWYLPHSRDHAPKLDVITRTANALRAANFDLVVEVDTLPRDAQAAEDDRTHRMSSRAERLDELADRAQADSDDAETRAREISARIPFGQPILVGHHSEARHRRDLDRIDKLHRAEFESHQAANELARKAEASRAAEALRKNPLAVNRKIAALTVQRDKVQRSLDGYRNHLRDVFPPAAGSHREQLLSNLAYIEEQLRFWRGVHQAQIDAGEVLEYGPNVIAKGDRVLYRGRWYEVARTNPKSVSVMHPGGGSWRETIPYHQLRDHHRANQ